jgi:hypothetical protein
MEPSVPGRCVRPLPHHRHNRHTNRRRQHRTEENQLGFHAPSLEKFPDLSISNISNLSNISDSPSFLPAKSDID